MKIKKRLDVLLTEQGYADTRSKAQAIIMSGMVYVDGQKADKPGTSFEETVAIEVRGETCPYVQYTVARCNSVLNKGGELTSFDCSNLNADEYEVVSLLGKFKEIVVNAGEKYEPSLITRYAIDVASVFNKFYIGNKIITDDKEKQSLRLAITKAVKITLTNALTLLGIETVEQM